MAFTERFSETHAVLASINLAVKSPAAKQYSAYVSLKNYHRAAAVFHIGAVAATGTVVLEIVQAQNSSGAGVKGIPTTAAQSKKTTVLTTADANSVCIIELRTEEMDIANGFEHVAIAHDVDTDTVGLAGILYGIEPRYAPVPVTNVNEIVD